ncbi:unnamed protein product [Sphagnum jensenii]|uniref:Uncharacterized protein n=1 Tax=Sphagnum jensenii TaxID=128206 RepID=A0ABP0WM06_9BRYO
MSGSFASECEACSRFRHSYSHYFIPLSSCVLLFGGPSELLTSGASERILHESLRQIDEFAMHMIQKRMQKLLESSTELRSGLNSDDAPEPLSSPPHMDLLSRFMGVAN